ncbi:hypothetical protein H0H93_013210 [Arthromyces matolae]|nr:hypothetical protein H0H93_013210 [Arthromyces matolae]
MRISTLHPVISHTLGPSTSFVGPAITRHSQERDEHVCSTYAAIASSSDLNADESGRTIWMWKQNLSGRLDDQSQKKKTLSLQHQISSLHTCDELPTRLFALSPQSELTVFDSDLAVKNTRPAPQALQNVLKTYCFSRTRDGFWHTYRLEPKDDDSIELTSISGPFRLTGLSFISKATNSEQISLLALSSSHVLLCALTDSPAPEIALLLWDLQYSVLLASHALPIPSTLTQSKDFGLKLNLVAASTTQALLILSAPTADSGPKSGGASLQSSVLVLPFTCPETSTIANAIGRASSGAKWMAETASSSTAALPHDPARTKLLSTMRAAMAKNHGDDDGGGGDGRGAFHHFPWLGRRGPACLSLL